MFDLTMDKIQLMDSRKSWNNLHALNEWRIVLNKKVFDYHQFGKPTFVGEVENMWNDKFKT